MNKAVFSLEEYRFDQVFIDFANKITDDALEIRFMPSGKFNSDSSTYELNFEFIAYNQNVDNPFVKINCIATYRFQDKITFEEIPPYFYRNSIAILFPYVRAFVSTVTLQANIYPILLPTMNLSDLESPLKENTIQIN